MEVAKKLEIYIMSGEIKSLNVLLFRYLVPNMRIVFSRLICSKRKNRSVSVISFEEYLITNYF